MAASLMSSSALKPPAPASLERLRVNGVPALVSRSSSSSRLKVEAKGGKLKTDKPYGINGGMALPSGLDASGRKQKGKGVYQFVDKYGANVDGYSPIYNTDDWSPSGDVYVGGSTGLLIWAVTLAGILAGGALLVYNTSALAQ
ncbi:photosystem II 10 kDa polypeptide, chloroplastic-like [Zingiber officinale]|uniref:photosystem II 10 kDa polypeptide, chloroplastic-like n=1 Tax=Zingiber officinale TaxID=94328 RepID=UPI001C4D0ADB|nr:photosystem II 10 kDa polypeptide, chloroplastic-like [Zingiber officinale]